MGTSRYLYENKGQETASRKLLYVSHSKYENDWQSIPHTHHFTEFFYVVKGCGSFLIEEEEYPIQEDDFIIVNANVSHTERSSGKTPLEYVTIGIEGLGFSFEDRNEHIIFNCKNQDLNLMFYMTAMLNEMEEKNLDYEKVCQDLLDVLIIKLIRRNHLAFELSPAAQIGRECRKLRRYIEANYMHPITLDSLAEMSHLNKYYLVHAFTKQCGCSPINYLCKVRIQASKELLETTNLSITEIAQSSGFSSQSYFAQCFQKSCNMTASAYRRLKKKT